MILLTGATGFLGRFLVEELLTAGEQIRLLVRHPEVPVLQHWLTAHPAQIELTQGDLLDAGTLGEAFTGITQVVHAAAEVSFRHSARERMRRVNVTGTANVVNFSLEAGVKKMVYVSSVAALGSGEKGAILTEETKWRRGSASSYYGYTKYMGEREVLRGVEEGLPSVIASPTLILGPGDWTKGPPRLFKMVDEGFPFYPVGGNGFVGAGDVAQAVRLLLASDYSEGERFILCAENLPYLTLSTLMAQAMGRKEPRIPLVPNLFVPAASLIEQINNGLITRETARNSSQVMRFDSSLFQQEFNFAFRPIADLVAETAKIYLAQKQGT